MRIAVLTNAFPPVHRGGAGRIAELQVEMLRQAGHDVRVWHPNISWLNKIFLIRLFYHVCDLFPRYDLIREIRAWQPEILFTHNLMGCGLMTPMFVKWSRGIRWIHMLHDVQLFEPSGQLFDAESITFMQSLWQGLRRSALGTPDLVVSPTQWLLDQHTRRGFFYGIESIVLPNPAFYHSSSIVRDTHNPINLLFLGGNSKAKGSQFLTELANAMTMPFILERIGEGTENGVLDSKQVLEKMKQADVLLVPSMIEENQPTVILEAASVGLPVIASNKGGIVETLAGAGRPLPLHVEVWKKEIEKCFEDKEYYKASVQKMIVLAKQHDPDRYRQRLVEVVTSKR